MAFFSPHNIYSTRNLKKSTYPLLGTTLRVFRSLLTGLLLNLIEKCADERVIIGASFTSRL